MNDRTVWFSVSKIWDFWTLGISIVPRQCVLILHVFNRVIFIGPHIPYRPKKDK